MNFMPTVEQLEDRCYVSASMPTPAEARATKKAYDTFLKEELKIFDRRMAEKRRRFVPRVISPPRIIVRNSRFRIANAVVIVVGRPNMRLSPRLPLEYFFVVWHPRLEKVFSIGDNRIKDAMALLRLDAVIIPGFGAVMVVKYKKISQAKRLERSIFWTKPTIKKPVIKEEIIQKIVPPVVTPVVPYKREEIPASPEANYEPFILLGLALIYALRLKGQKRRKKK